MRRFLHAIVAGSAFALAATSLPVRTAAAADRWVDRPMTLPRLVFAGDVGLGIRHIDPPIGPSSTRAGLNLEGAIGVTDKVELGLRTGVRFDGGRADSYGRTLWTETYGTGGSTFANPEARVRWVFHTGNILEAGTRFGTMIGIPLTFHATDFLRIDTGAYVPFVFGSNTLSGIVMPGYFWFQANEKLWLGPMSALRITNLEFGNHDPHLLLGFGLGYQVASAVDLKTMIIFPAIDNGVVREWGAGFGVQFRIGE